MSRAVFAAVAVFLAASMAAAGAAPSTKNQDDGLVIEDVLLASANEAARTAESTLGVTNGRMSGANWSKARVEVNYTYAGAGITDLTVTPWCQRAVNGTYARYTARDCSTTVCVTELLTDTYESPAASVVYMLDYDVRGCHKFKVVVAGTGSPDAADAVSVGIVKLAGE